MAATKGLNILVDVDGSTVALQRGGTLRINGDPIDITTKDDAVWKQFLMGHLTGEVTCEGLMDINGATHEALFTALVAGPTAGTTVTLKFTHESDKSRYLSGTCFVTNLEQRGAHDGAAEFSATFQLTGALSYTDA